MPLFSIAQNDWEQLMQPSSILQHKVFQSNPFIHHTAVGGLAFSDSSSVGISVENKYLITSLSKLNISAQFKTLHGGLSIHMNTMANEIFSGVSMGMGYGIRLSKTLGIGVDGKVKRDQFRGFVPFFILSPQLGLLYLFAKKGSISVHLTSIHFTKNLEIFPPVLIIRLLSRSNWVSKSQMISEINQISMYTQNGVLQINSKPTFITEQTAQKYKQELFTA
jgi:hypothetical protein